MTCDRFTDQIELYAAGALEKSDAQILQAHLETGCVQCGSRLEEALLQAALISSAAPQIQPPPSLRSRIAGSFQVTPSVTEMPRKKRAQFAPWLIAAAACAALVLGVTYEENARRAEAVAVNASMEASAKATDERTAAMLTILQAPGTKQVSFDVNQANLPHGSLFIHKNLGVAMVLAHLPAAPQGWKYESWVVPKNGAPRPVESFGVNDSGVAFTVVKGPVDVSQWSSMAVSLEPANSMPVKPTRLVVASPV